MDMLSCHIRVLLALLALSLPAVCPPVPAAAIPLSSTTLGQVLLTVQISGASGKTARGKFVLDTGSTGSLISRSLAQTLDLPMQTANTPEGRPIIAHGQALRLVSLPRLTVGQVSIQRAQCLVFDDATLNTMTGQPIDGVIGENILSLLSLFLDFPQHQATLLPHGGLSSAELAALGMNNAAVIPLTRSADSAWYTCSAQLQSASGSITRPLIVDTGSVGSLISSDTAQQIGLSHLRRRRPEQQALTPTGVVRAYAARLLSLSLQGHPNVTFSPAFVTCAEDPLPSNMAETLGLNVLRHFRVLLDLPGFTLYVAPPAPPTAQTTLPFTPASGWPMPLIQVQANGTTPITLAVDTGTNFSALTDTLASKLGLVPTPYSQNGKPYTLLGKQANAVSLPTLAVGTFTLKKQRMLILFQSQLSSLLGQPVDGILGLDVLRHFVVELDYAQHQLTLRDTGPLSAAALQSAGFTGAASVPLTEQPETGLYLVPAQFQNGSQTGQEALAIDSGSGVTALSHALATKLGLSPDGTSQSTSTMNGTFSITLAHVPQLQIGTLTLPNYPVVSPDKDGQGYAPLLGADVLSQFHVLLDFPGKTLYLLPVSSTPPQRKAP